MTYYVYCVLSDFWWCCALHWRGICSCLPSSLIPSVSLTSSIPLDLYNLACLLHHLCTPEMDYMYIHLQQAY
jgi:hypothetical protein